MQEPGHKAEYMGCMCIVYVMDDSKKKAITHGSLGTVWGIFGNLKLDLWLFKLGYRQWIALVLWVFLRIGWSYIEEVNVVVNVLHNLAKQLAHIEQKLDIKVDCTKAETLETIVNGLNNSYAGWVTKSLDESKTVIEKSKLDRSAVLCTGLSWGCFAESILQLYSHWLKVWLSTPCVIFHITLCTFHLTLYHDLTDITMSDRCVRHWFKSMLDALFVAYFRLKCRRA